MNNNCKYKDMILDDQQDLNTIIKDSYSVYCDCKNSDITFLGKKILYKTELDLHTNKELGFEHIVSIKQGKYRIYDKNRAIYVPLIKKILSECLNKKCNSISIYRDYKDICVWCRENKYLIVLTPRNDGYLLNTAYPVIYGNKLNEVEKKANENGL